MISAYMYFMPRALLLLFFPCLALAIHNEDLTARFAECAKSATNGVAALRCEVVLPTNASPSQALLCVTDRDGNWFQQLSPDTLIPGTNTCSFDLSPESAAKWSAYGHRLVWNSRVLRNPKSVVLRVFPTEVESQKSNVESLSAGRLTCDLRLTTCDLQGPPEATDIHPNATEVPCFGLFELKFQLPDRYDDPFDPAVIDVTAFIEQPGTNGAPIVIPGFYSQDYYVVTNAYADERIPYGRPGWAVRYAPLVPGRHSCRIVARDAVGVSTSAPVFFNATSANGPAFVRVSTNDWRRFSAGGREIHLVGHNIRSPFDTRMDDQFPWVLRHPGSFLAYRRYFRDMAAAGENFAEVWMCQWSLGLEWSTNAPCYYGVGDYNLGNAWELDQVLRTARENGIRVNLVLNNHGRAGLGFDAEWQNSPYNVIHGGFLPAEDPMPFFTDPRALEYQKRICRYIVARWGWDSTIFAWELWSELDLCGRWGREPSPQNDPGVIDWHRKMGDYLRAIDPNRHLISTHISADYRSIGKELSSIPQIDHCCVDAYHFSPNPLHIVDLVRETAASLAAYQKPALITEFGGSSMGAGLSHLKCELHAALWSSTCSTLAATPLFWWWGLVEEQNLYPEYTAIRTFTDNIAYTDPALQPVNLSVTDTTPRENGDQQGQQQGQPGQQQRRWPGIQSMAISSGTNLCAWVYTPNLIAIARGEEDAIKDTQAEVVWSPVSNGTYRVAFCSTKTGKPVKQQDFRTEQGSLRFPLPPFTGDIAIRVTPLILVQ